MVGLARLPTIMFLLVRFDALKRIGFVVWPEKRQKFIEFNDALVFLWCYLNGFAKQKITRIAASYAPNACLNVTILSISVIFDIHVVCKYL